MLMKYEPWSVKNEKIDAWGIKFLSGNFADTVISFTTIDLKENSNDMVVDYHVINPPTDPLANLSSEEFKNELEEIINDILRKAMDEFNKDRDSYTTESAT